VPPPKDRKGDKGAKGKKSERKESRRTFIGAGHEFVGALERADGSVRLFDLADPGKPVTLEMPRHQGPAAAPSAVYFGAGRAYLLLGGDAAGGLRSPALAAYELTGGKLLWPSDLLPADAGAVAVARGEA